VSPKDIEDELKKAITQRERLAAKSHDYNTRKQTIQETLRAAEQKAEQHSKQDKIVLLVSFKENLKVIELSRKHLEEVNKAIITCERDLKEVSGLVNDLTLKASRLANSKVLSLDESKRNPSK
jgi:hypothetical protein